MCNIMESLLSMYRPLSLPVSLIHTYTCTVVCIHAYSLCIHAYSSFLYLQRPASITKELAVSRQFGNCIIHNNDKVQTMHIYTVYTVFFLIVYTIGT